jgi:hypothetical protein
MTNPLSKPYRRNNPWNKKKEWSLADFEGSSLGMFFSS